MNEARSHEALLSGFISSPAWIEIEDIRSMILNTIRSLHTRYQTIRPSSIPRSLKIASSFSSSTSSWAGEDERRLCHAVIRVRSVSEQVNYYQKHFGMSVQKSDPGGSTTVGFGNKKFAVKLIEDPSLKEEDLGKGFGHFGLVLQVGHAIMATCHA